MTGTPNITFVTEISYCTRHLSRIGMETCNPIVTPLPTNVDLHPWYASEAALDTYAHHKYRSIISGISYFYLANSTRTYPAFSISALDRTLHAPSARHFAFAKGLLRYIKRKFTLWFTISCTHTYIAKTFEGCRWRLLSRMWTCKTFHFRLYLRRQRHNNIFDVKDSTHRCSLLLWSRIPLRSHNILWKKMTMSPCRPGPKRYYGLVDSYTN